MTKEEIKPIIAEMKEILNKYPDRQLEILLYVFGRDNLMKIINEPTYEQLQEMHKTMARYALENEAKIDKLKSTLEEIRRLVNKEIERYGPSNLLNIVLQIIDKGVNND